MISSKQHYWLSNIIENARLMCRDKELSEDDHQLIRDEYDRIIREEDTPTATKWITFRFDENTKTEQAILSLIHATKH